MRTRAAATLLMAVLVLGVLAQPATTAPNPVVASATGSGHMVRAGFFRTFTFAAQKYADGTSTGQLELRSPQFDVVIHLRIDCLLVDGNEAHMSGLITFTSNPDEAFVGELNRVAVRDNGEGPGAEPDLVSGIPANPRNENPDTCEDRSLTPDRVVQSGNVRVQG